MVAEEEKCCPMEAVASRACDHVYGARVGSAGRKIEVRGRNLKLLHHFLREAHLGAERAYRQDAAAIHRDSRTAASCSGVAARRSQHRNKSTVVVAARWRLHPWFELCQLEKTAAVQRQSLDLLP